MVILIDVELSPILIYVFSDLVIEVLHPESVPHTWVAIIY